MKVLTIGGATKDLFLHYKYPESLLICSDQDNYTKLLAGKKIEIDKVHQALGGGSTNTATSFSRLGFDATTLCKIGQDHAGLYILNQLQQTNISTSSIIIDKTITTAESFILPACNQDSTLLVYRGQNTFLDDKDIPYDQLSQYDQLYISSLSCSAASLIDPIAAAAKKYKIPLAVNPGMEQLCEDSQALINALPNIDTFILNACEAQEFLYTLSKTHTIDKGETIHNGPQLLQNRSFNLREYFRLLLSKLNPISPIAIVTNGAEGVYVAHNKTIYFHPSITDKTIISTVGAGDAFGSCFVASRMLGQSIEQAMAQGILNSVSVLQHQGAQEGLLTTEKLNDLYKNSSKSLVKKIAL
ncbi:hypothetical protein A3F06_02255 [candidate division TM6 bacterium RIFCSPHIGHO2_12_FULL_36_22]|nr:MAG: hypothetical protein A3F06_02255 [candidate division TM6 bacterium RIFCSPHIGHO2_12_FULL_36_22]